MRDYSKDIKRYRSGEMTPAERHALEREALSDPFLADALEGAELLTPEDFQADVNAVNQSVKQQTRRNYGMWRMQPWRIAAVLIILVLATFGIINLLQENETRPLAMEYAKPDSSPVIQSPMISADTVDSRPAEPIIKKQIQAEPKGKQRITGTEKSVQVPALSDAALQQAQPAETEQELNKPNEQKTLAGAEPPVVHQAPVMSLRSAETSATGTVTGRVVDDDGKPIPGVRVMVMGTNQVAVTAADGTYNITALPGQKLVFSFIGMETIEAEVKTVQMPEIKMREDVSIVSEIKVGGHSGKIITLKEFTASRPKGGFRAYLNYLEQHVQYPAEARQRKIEGRVVAEFVVEPNGAISQLKIIRGIGGGCDEELMRLIREGPRWIPAQQNKVAVRDTVLVQLRFRLPK
ncbi:MAG: TonB family protein [Cyclobacteriaceae bacterium]|nr:TonB family protein [Cyclobacteriaceae bacterium]